MESESQSEDAGSLKCYGIEELLFRHGVVNQIFFSFGVIEEESAAAQLHSVCNYTRFPSHSARSFCARASAAPSLTRLALYTRARSR